jgi:hypothetical protein
MFFLRLTLMGFMLFLVFGCEHTNAIEPTFKCDNSNLLTFSAIQPIITLKCAVGGCHDGIRPSIPTLLTEQELKDNVADIKMQIDRGAMPPAESVPLTVIEKAKLACWLSAH